LTLTNTKIEEYVRTYLKVVLLKKLAILIILHLFCQEASLNFQSPPLSAACLMFGTYLGYTGAERKILNLGKVSTDPYCLDSRLELPITKMDIKTMYSCISQEL
jgi:hypothetical protein